MTNEEMQALRAMMNRFDLLTENQGIILEKLEKLEKLDELETLDIRVTTLEAAVKKLNREVQQLKKAQ